LAIPSAQAFTLPSSDRSRLSSDRFHPKKWAFIRYGSAGFQTCRIAPYRRFLNRHAVRTQMPARFFKFMVSMHLSLRRFDGQLGTFSFFLFPFSFGRYAARDELAACDRRPCD